MSTKRKAVSSLLARRVRPRREEEWEPESDQPSGSESEGGDDASEEGTRQGPGGSDTETSDGSHSDGESEEDDAPPKVDISSISFGALARAQASLPPSARKNKSSKLSAAAKGDDDDDDDTAASLRHKKTKDRPKPAKRSSKHAPQEQTSKKPVSRRREVVSDDPATAKRTVRDPRFDPFGATRVDEIKARKAYAFLDEYRDRELADLRAQLRKTKPKDEAQRAAIKREILSMESKRKAKVRKEEEERLLAEHKRKEKELVAQGKNPFYLKRSEQKKQLLTNRFESMSKGQVDRAIERKRKKMAGKEKKELGSIQRITERQRR